MQNLKDKLLKAGLVTNEQAKKAEAVEAERPLRPEARPQARPTSGASGADLSASGAGASNSRRDMGGRPSHSGASPSPSRYTPPRGGYQVPVIRAAPPIPKLAPLPGSRAHQRLEALKQQELDEQLRHLVRQAQIELELGEQAFYFQTRKGKLRRLNLGAEQAGKLERGELAVVERQEPAAIEHSLVPAATADQMLALFPRSVRFFNKEGSPIGFLSESERAQSVDESPDAAPEAPAEATDANAVPEKVHGSSASDADANATPSSHGAAT